MIRALITAFVALAFAGAAHAQIPGGRQHVQAELVSSRVAVAPGERFVVALRQVIDPGWHTYWINPGDSGIATTIKWYLPAGFRAGEIEWPAPDAIEIEGLVNYGFSGEVLFPVELTAPKESGPATLRARADWLACADVCIPESADLVLNVDVSPASHPDETWAPRLSAARAALPQPANLETKIGKAGDRWALTVRGGALAAFLSAGEVRAPHYFPLAGDAIDHAAKQAPRIGADAIVFALTPAPGADLATKPLDGVVTLEVKEGGAWVKRAFIVGAASAGAPPADIGTPSGAGSLGLAAALLFALLGGLILNVMPCVFPVLSIKALSLAKDQSVARRDGLLFLAGVMTTFLVLASALIALQAAGAQIGWGFQLQEPWVVSLLALLFFAIGLNLHGAYEIGAGVQNVGASLAAKSGAAGAFFTGALAVIAATPCTAPFMGAAMGFAATQPPAVSLLVFAALGLGFAAPFVALSLVPQLRRWLPKPGAWMETFKQFLAFPMFAAAIWLVWVLNEQTGAGTVLLLLSAFLAFGFAVWALRTLRSRVMRYGAVGIVALLVSAIFVGAQQRPAQASSAAPADGLAGPLAYEVWSPEREAQLIGEGKAVFVNFTAAWCVTCQVNEKVALQTREVADAFAAQNVTYLKADWTARDSVIAAALKKHGRAGVPLYLFYPAGAGSAPPKVLPQILTPGLVLEAIGATEE